MSKKAAAKSVRKSLKWSPSRETAGASPTHSPSRHGIPPLKFDFPGAIRSVLQGKRMTRQLWADEQVYILVADGYLRIHLRDGSQGALMVDEVDLRADDWVALRP